MKINKKNNTKEYLTSLTRPPRPYNPSVIMPEELWKNIYENNLVTLKGLIVVGWRTGTLKELAILNSVFYRGTTMIDIMSALGSVRRKRVHVKFVGRESSEVSKIYAEHLRLNTTMSNYLLSLSIKGLYSYVNTVLHYRDYSANVIERARQDRQYLEELLKSLVRYRMKVDGVDNFMNNILYASRRLNRRIQAKIGRLLYKLNTMDLEDVVNSVVNIMFNIRPKLLCKMYLGMYTSLGS